MSRAKELHEGQRWLDTGAEDMRAARVLIDAGLHARACSAAQQCAEKAVKGLCYAEGGDPWGHSVQKLVTVCTSLATRTDLDTWRRKAGALDRSYTATRYPNGLPDLTPEESYFREDAKAAIAQAERIMKRCREVYVDIARRRPMTFGSVSST